MDGTEGTEGRDGAVGNGGSADGVDRGIEPGKPSTVGADDVDVEAACADPRGVGGSNDGGLANGFSAP